MRVDIRSFGDLFCPIHTSLTYASRMISAWMLVLVSIERCIAVVMPLKAKLICKTKVMILTAVIASSVIIGGHGHFLVGIENINGTRCSLDESSAYHKFFYTIWIYIDLSLSVVLPFTICCSCNCLIVRAIRKSQLRRKMMVKKGNGQAGKEKIDSLTAMLLITNVTFVVTTLPYTAYNNNVKRRQDFNELYDSTMILVSYVNYAINFWLYCFSGPRFRKQLRSKVCRRHCFVHDKMHRPIRT
ncbi:cysteinyl leukotriene receptor 1-like [Tubulanus polymorphus]|uniref:cysteinyl leukotriene receptor 1-like n=1 Tax=Tubulanus polymorphus TaxID=672921 RepID=UPI003DA2F500